MNKGQCRSCNAEIWWATTLKNKAIPLDPNPHPNGNVVIIDGKAVVNPQEEHDGLRYVSHFYSCPNASAHRR